jgi:hypothetical protein
MPLPPARVVARMFRSLLHGSCLIEVVATATMETLLVR